MTTTIWWIRRDLRLGDNPALHAALQGASQLIPLFILDPRLLRSPAQPRKVFLFAGLRRLDADLRQLGSRLVVRSGEPLEVLRKVVEESGSSRVFAAEDYSPYALRRDERIAQALPLTQTPGVMIRHPASVVKADGNPYTVYTPFSKAWKALSLPQGSIALPPPASLPLSGDLPSDALPESSPTPLFPPGEAEALRRLEHFCSGSIYAYADDRNRLDVEGTSVLSPYLRFGMLSPRQALAAALSARSASDDTSAQRGVDTWINELIWREFYTAILYHFPEVLNTAFNPSLRIIPWREAPDDLDAWQSGLTGYPAVDAGMRQLAATGWMHNRARMLTASFLVKDLLLSWQEGECWFMHMLVDGDPAANNGGWQWTAGVGTDAAPYFRVFNPVLQGMKFDPRGAYVRRWLPELADLPVEWIHQPWEMPIDAQSHYGFKPGRDYPLPIVDHAFARGRALQAYRATQTRPH
jgi:deoxyribodipyrimidine photo-lyase